MKRTLPIILKFNSQIKFCGWVFMFLVYLPFISTSQDTIKLLNSSFEGLPKKGQLNFWTGIKGWVDCGPLHYFNGETPPDLHPGGFWGNHLPAADGNTYLGLVARDNGTYESVSQRLVYPLPAGQCYTVSIHLATAEILRSNSRITGDTIDYSTPLVLQVYGDNNLCQQKELLFESSLIEHTQWRHYTFAFQPKEEVRYLSLVAHNKLPTAQPFGGNLLLDGISDIIKVDCATLPK